jgi:hypothetical protein
LAELIDEHAVLEEVPSESPSIENPMSITAADSPSSIDNNNNNIHNVNNNNSPQTPEKTIPTPESPSSPTTNNNTTNTSPPSSPPHQTGVEAPPNLTPASGDAYLFLTDVCTMAGGDTSAWLQLGPISPNFGLELIESALNGHTDVFMEVR